MSSHSEPYANGFGILAGILILWIGTLALVFATGFLSLFKPPVDEGGEDPGDEEILSRASRESRTLVTPDKDFGEFSIVHRQRHAGILRLVNLSARQHRGMPSGSYEFWCCSRR